MKFPAVDAMVSVVFGAATLFGTLSFVLIAIPAMERARPGRSDDDDPYRQCRRECDQGYEDRNAICNGLSTSDERSRCKGSSFDVCMGCLKRCR